MNKIYEHRFMDLYDISSGISSTPEQAGHGFPFASFRTVFNNYFLPEKLSDLMDTSEQERVIYSIKKGDILLTRTSETFDELAMSCVALKDYDNATFSGFVKRLRPKVTAQGIVDEKYMGFYLRGYLFRRTITNHSLLTLRASFNEDIFSFLKLFLPEYDQQVKIGDFLYLLERKINLNNAIIDELESTARTLYDYWFTQFDFPDENGKPYKSSGGAMEYSKDLKREIPKGWRVARIKDVTGIVLGGTPSKGVDEYWGGEFHWLNSGEVSNFPVVDSELYVTREGIDNSATKLMPKRTTIISITGNIRVSILGIETCANQSVVGVYETESLKCQYLYPIITGMLASYKAVSTGNCQTHINKGTVEDTKIVVPTDEILSAYYAKSEPLYKMIFDNAIQNKDLTELRDYLLPLLMNGQVRVATTESAADVTVEEKPQPVAVKEPSKREVVFKRLVLSAYILDNICDEPTAGRVKFEKLLYLSEYCAQLPLHSEFQRAAAGPYDSKSLYSIESELNQNKWFKRQKVAGESRAYTRLAKFDGYKQYVDTNLTAAQKTVIDKLITLFKTSRTIQCEIVATLYGAWNDFLLEGIQPTEDQIVNEVLTNWHEKKERISRNRWLKALEWMRNEGIIPVGYGVSTKGDSR